MLVSMDVLKRLMVCNVCLRNYILTLELMLVSEFGESWAGDLLNLRVYPREKWGRHIIIIQNRYK